MTKLKEFILKYKRNILIVCFVVLAVALICLGLILKKDNSSSKQEQTSSSEMKTYTTADRSTSSIDLQTESSIEITTESSEETTTTQETEETTEEPTTEYIPVEYPYMIKVNRAANCTTVYGKDENGNYTVPVKAITVSCGENIGDTPLGDYNTIISYEWRLLFGNVYGHYAYRIIGSTLFHSVPYYTASNDDLEWHEYNKLGSPASMGCVRMTVADAKWLVENCPVGTRVIIYDDASNPGPLGKPDTIKIPADSPYRGWDPTDPHPNNPWHQFTASITYPASKVVSVEEGSSIADIISNFSAKDTCGNDISNKIKVTGQYNLNVTGKYSINVNVTDAIGRYAEVDVTLEVKERATVPPTTEKVTTTAPTTEKVTTTAPTTENVTTTEPTTENDVTTETTTEKESESSSIEETTTQKETTTKNETTAQRETTTTSRIEQMTQKEETTRKQEETKFDSEQQTTPMIEEAP